MPVRLGLRHILPALLLPLYIILVVSGERQIGPLTPEQRRELANMHMPTPLATELAIAINLPAIAPALPTFAAIYFFGGEPVMKTRWVDSAVFGLFVPVLWYFVGPWVDRRVGLAPIVMRNSSHLAKAGFALLVVLAAFSIIVIVGGRGWNPHNKSISTALLCWTVFGAIALYVRITRETRKKAMS
jgi:hypothetical protein